jgi:hypothetical protein
MQEMNSLFRTLHLQDGTIEALRQENQLLQTQVQVLKQQLLRPATHSQGTQSFLQEVPLPKKYDDFDTQQLT